MLYDEFAGLVVLVTGACGGIGSRIALDFVRNGATVVATDINPDKLKELEKNLNQAGNGVCIPMVMDVTDNNSVEKAIESIATAHGPIDRLINCAGVSQMILAVDLTEKDWDFVMDVNAKGVFLCTQHVVRQMIKSQKQGKVVTIASIAGKLGSMWQSHYCASKAAVIGFTQGIALELAKHQININCVCPAYVKTEMQDREVLWEAGLRGWDPLAVRKNYIDMTPLGRLETPEDVSKLVLFLSSRGADFITGQAYNVTGGVYMG